MSRHKGGTVRACLGVVNSQMIVTTVSAVKSQQLTLLLINSAMYLFLLLLFFYYFLNYYSLAKVDTSRKREALSLDDDEFLEVSTIT